MRLLLTFFTLLLFSLPVLAADVVVKKARIGQHGERTRVVLETDRPIEPSVFTLPSPYRVVVDGPVMNFRLDLHDVKQPPGSLVKNMRAGLFKPDTTRMVLDVKRAVATKIFTIGATKSKPFRVVIDLVPAKESIVLKKPSPVFREAKRAPRKKIEKQPRRAGDPVVIVIDPGHGGVDPGAISKHKIYEKHVVLEIGKKLHRQLNRIPGVKAYMTRDRDVFVRLQDRVRVAQQKNADLFISIHADAHKNRRVRGGSVYVLSEKASDKEAARLADHANRGDLVAGLHLENESSDVRDILIDLAQRETMNKSAFLGNEVLEELGKEVHLRKQKILFAGFKVLKAPDVPSVLVELSYLSNLDDERRLRDPARQESIASALSRGVRDYIKKHMHN